MLILVVCALFVANSATAAIRGRRPELGVLACLGWSRTKLFLSAIGEVTGIGLLAGLLGAAPPCPSPRRWAARLGRRAPCSSRRRSRSRSWPARAGLAGRPRDPDRRRPPAGAGRPPRPQPGGVTAMAVRNVARTPAGP